MGSNDGYHSSLSALSWLFGVWESVEAEVCYPTMDTLKYSEVVEFQPTTKPIMEYKSETWHAVKKMKMHCETGFLRIDPETQKVALLLSHSFGVTEVSEGPVEKGDKLCLESQSISRMSFSKTTATVEKIVRKWALEEDGLHSTVLMQTSNQPLQLHLKCRYKRKS